MSNSMISIQWKEHDASVTSFLKISLDSDTLTDLTLSADGKIIRAHRAVLSSCSPFFKTILSENPCQDPFVILSDIKFPVLKMIVDFMYHGKLILHNKQIPDVLEVAETLHVTSLIDAVKKIKKRCGQHSEKEMNKRQAVTNVMSQRSTMEKESNSSKENGSNKTGVSDSNNDLKSKSDQGSQSSQREQSTLKSKSQNMITNKRNNNPASDNEPEAMNALVPIIVMENEKESSLNENQPMNPININSEKDSSMNVHEPDLMDCEGDSSGNESDVYFMDEYKKIQKNKYPPDSDTESMKNLPKRDYIRRKVVRAAMFNRELVESIKHAAVVLQMTGEIPIRRTSENEATPRPRRIIRRDSSIQHSTDFRLALEAVRCGELGFCKAAKTFKVNNRTLWLEYKKRGYPPKRPQPEGLRRKQAGELDYYNWDSDSS
ncbi:longitudinals lacking protein, isoforms H/M/V-like [Macrosteles quadrilineatus]|uniref:longitudinals lacking protein, isoforms H/M/V-like n=1 Tax=Macrosteles quadrilineatus TaxID=74068 RepID=UPI0023E2B39D|nr:longitudinals lacking protein, isoforms H/M/V-like [Macrosteles quadrilineatus]